MKKQLIGFLILMAIASEGISQTSKDTICLPIEQLKKAALIIEKSKVDSEKIQILTEKVTLAEKRIAAKDSTISAYDRAQKTYDTIIQTYVGEIENHIKIEDNLKTQNKLITKLAKRQKRTKWLGAILGLTAGYLLAK